MAGSVSEPARTSEICALRAEAAQDTTPALKDCRRLGSQTGSRGVDEVVLGVGVQIRGTREGRGSPYGKLSGCEGTAVVATNVSTGSGVAGEISG